MMFNRVLGFIVLTWTFWGLSDHSTPAQQIQQPTSTTISDNLMYIPVRLNGRGPYNFILDSGEPGMGLIDQHVAKELGLTIVGFEEISNGNQVKRAFLVGVNKLSVGQIAQSNLKLRVGNYNTTPKQITVDGIIGRAFFYSYLLTINGPGRHLITSENRLQAQDKDVLKYTNAFLITGKVGSKDLVFNLNIGSNLPFLFPMASLEGIHYTTTPNQRVITQTSPSFVVQEAIINDEITLSGVRLKNQKVYYSDKAHQITVGIDFLKEHTITLDQRAKLIRIE